MRRAELADKPPQRPRGGLGPRAPLLLATLAALSLLALTCKKEPPPAVYIPTLALAAVDASCTEAWLKLTTTFPLPGPTRLAPVLFSNLQPSIIVRVYELMKYIQVHLFRKTLSVQEIKKACRCRNNNTVSLFKQEFEQEIRRYIARRRLDAAAYVMRRKRVTVCVVAACVGYTEELFWRDFKAKYGCTPLQFMKVNCEELRLEQTGKMLGQDTGSRQKSKTKDQRETDRSTLSLEEQQ